jgi:hypothetical protein
MSRVELQENSRMAVDSSTIVAIFRNNGYAQDVQDETMLLEMTSWFRQEESNNTTLRFDYNILEPELN